MENASKALIIAGAILLAILLISLGIMIFNQAQDTVNNSGMTQAEITAFNNKFLKYEGTGKTKSDIQALVNEVTVSNADASNTNRKIANYNASDKSVIINSVSNKVSTSKLNKDGKYKISVLYCTNPETDRKGYSNTLTKGCIFKINIEEI